MGSFSVPVQLYTVPTTGLFGKYSHWITHRKCLPGHCDRVHTNRVLDRSLTK